MKIINGILIVLFVHSLLLYIRAFISNKFMNPSEPKVFEQWKMEMKTTQIMIVFTTLCFVFLNFVFL